MQLKEQLVGKKNKVELVDKVGGDINQRDYQGNLPTSKPPPSLTEPPMNRDLKREHESFLQSLLRHCTVPQFGELDWSVLPTCSWFTIFTMYKKTMYVRNIDLPLSAKLPKCKQVSHTLNT